MATSENMESSLQILVACYYAQSRSGEQFIPDHVFGYMVSGTMEMYDGKDTFTLNPGDYGLLSRNQLAKFTKTPPPGGVFKSVSVSFDQQTLLSFSREYGFVSNKGKSQQKVFPLKEDELYRSYLKSIESYQQLNDADNRELIQLKVKELLLLIMKINPEMKDVLFDFNEPGKIDLEAFMNRNFQFNVEMKRFAYLTGRSLATFKRDFAKIYHTSPNRWLQQRRLQEAFYLIKEKGRKPSDVYIEVGFENLSHFSYSFKQNFGIAPSLVGSL